MRSLDCSPWGQTNVLSPDFDRCHNLENLPPLPQCGQQKSSNSLIFFVLLAVLPVALASVYYFFVAASQYHSEYRFAVRGTPAMPIGSVPTGTAPGPTGTIASGLSSVLGVS
jgi:hypothetical protein